METRHPRLGETAVDQLLDGVFEAPRDILVHGEGGAARAATSAASAA